MPRHPLWSVEAIARLTKLWAEGYSTSVIAAQLRTTRGAVAGKIDRLKLPARRTTKSWVRRRRTMKQPRAFVPTETIPATPPRFVIRKPRQEHGGTEPSKAELRRMFEQAWANTANGATSK